MSQSSSLHTLGKWTITLFTVLMVVTAALAGNGIYKGGSDPWLVTGHQHIGNLLFVLAVAQLIVCYLLYTRKAVSGAVIITSVLMFLATFAQIGLGYSTRSNLVNIAGWHIALGVALTATTAVLAALFWLPTGTRNGANSAG